MENGERWYLLEGVNRSRRGTGREGQKGKAEVIQHLGVLPERTEKRNILADVSSK